jgi:hypothetical protein
VSVDVDVIVFCECGVETKNFAQEWTRDMCLKITPEPCENCLVKEFERGKKEGYDEGMLDADGGDEA